MHNGTGRVASRAGSAMRKRGRGSRDASAQEPAECPICYSALTARTEKRPFQCSHALCAICHARMLDEEDNRCPQCRAPRIGFSRRQAEPSPSRNHPLPSLNDLVADMPPALRDMLDLMNDNADQQPHDFVSGAARGYGLPPGRRPATGHTMFFAVQPPTAWAPNLRERAPGETRVTPDLLALPRALAQTLVSMNALPREAIEGLLNVPDVPLSEWHRRFAQRPTASAPQGAGRRARR